MKSILILISLLNFIFSEVIKTAPLFTLFDVKDYYIKSLKKTIFIINNSENRNIILQIFDEKIIESYICFTKATAQTTKSCKRFILYQYYDNVLGSFNQRTLYIVFNYISSGKIKILNNEEINIEVRNNQDIKCFDFYQNSHLLTYKFNLFFYYNLNATINIQYTSYLNEPSKIYLTNTQTSKNILSTSYKYENKFITLDSKYKYLLEFTPPYNDQHSLLCLSFSQNDYYFVDEKIKTVPLIAPSSYTFYTYLLNSSNIKGKEYNTIIHFSFDISQYKNCSLYYRKIGNNTYQEEKSCSLNTKDNRSYAINFKVNRDNIIFLELYLIPLKIEIDYNNVSTFSFYKKLEEVDNYPFTISYIQEINNTLYFILPLFFITHLLLLFLMSYKCNEYCES